MSKPHVKEMWSGSQLKVFFSFLLWDREVGFFFARSKGLHPLSYGSRFIESPSTNYFWYPTTTTILPTETPTGLQRLQLPWTSPPRRALRLEPGCVTGHIPPCCIQTCLWRMAETSKHWKRSPLLANFAQLEQCWKTSTGSWREGTAEIHFWPSSHLSRSTCPKESLQMLILQMSKKAAGVEPEGTDSVHSMPSKY